MKSYKVIAPFLFRRETISVRPEWTPPNQEMADRLIAAGCLRDTSANAAVGLFVGVVNDAVDSPNVSGAITNTITHERIPAISDEKLPSTTPQGGNDGRGRRGHFRRGR